MGILAIMSGICVLLAIWAWFGKRHWEQESELRECDLLLAAVAGPLCFVKWNVCWKATKNRLWFLLYLAVATILALIDYYEQAHRRLKPGQ